MQNRYTCFSLNCGLKNKNINLQDFKDVDFNFTHFANFEFAYFEIEESFGLICVKLQNGRFHLQISILGTKKVLVANKGFIFTHFVYNRNFGQIWAKIIECSIRVENCHFRFSCWFHKLSCSILYVKETSGIFW